MGSTPAYDAHTQRRVGETNPMQAYGSLLILRESRGTASPPRSRAAAGRVERACARPDLSSPQRIALAERTHVSEMSQAAARVESSRETQRFATGSGPLARLRASLTRYWARRQPTAATRTSRVGETKPTGGSVSLCENEPTCPNCRKALCRRVSPARLRASLTRYGLDTGLAHRQGESRRRNEPDRGASRCCETTADTRGTSRVGETNPPPAARHSGETNPTATAGCPAA
jgi:hypothetical protein